MPEDTPQPRAPRVPLPGGQARSLRRVRGRLSPVTLHFITTGLVQGPTSHPHPIPVSLPITPPTLGWSPLTGQGGVWDAMATWGLPCSGAWGRPGPSLRASCGCRRPVFPSEAGSQQQQAPSAARSGAGSAFSATVRPLLAAGTCDTSYQPQYGTSISDSNAGNVFPVAACDTCYHGNTWHLLP